MLEPWSRPCWRGLTSSGTSRSLPSGTCQKSVLYNDKKSCLWESVSLEALCHRSAWGREWVGESCWPLRAAGACQASTGEPASRTFPFFNLPTSCQLADQGKRISRVHIHFHRAGSAGQTWRWEAKCHAGISTHHHHHHSVLSQQPRSILDSSCHHQAL